MSENSNIKRYQRKPDQILSHDRPKFIENDHQMEFVDEVNGVAYINDSKSTRLTATRNSLEAIETSVVLIVGGNDKENDYSVLAQQVKQKVVAIVYLGDNSHSILKHYSAHNMLFAKAATIREAVQTADTYSQSGDVVLFSPACEHSSNYKNRGNEFKEIVKSLLPQPNE